MSPPPLTRRQVDDLALQIRDLLEAIEAGRLDASRAMIHRLEGAFAALEAVAGKHPSLLDALGPPLPPGPPKPNDRLV